MLSVFGCWDLNFLLPYGWLRSKRMKIHSKIYYVSSYLVLEKRQIKGYLKANNKQLSDPMGYVTNTNLEISIAVF